MMKKLKFIAGALAAVLLFGGLAACNDSAGNTDGDVREVKVGVVGSNNEQWDPVIASLAEDNINLELVEFTDYIIPNQALRDGDVDLNAFQHQAFLDNWNNENDGDLVSIGETLIAPLSIYSDKWDDVADIPDGGSVAIPSDATNGGRALKLLEQAGLLSVDPGAGWNAAVGDITDNPKNLDIVEVEAAQTASLLPDVEAAIINGGHAIDNGLSPMDDALVVEDWESGEERGNPYVNIIAARSADRDNALYRAVVDAYQTEEVAEIIRDVFEGAYVPAFEG